MPSLPTYTSQRNITASAPAPMRNEATAPFENNQKVLGAMTQVAQAWSDAQDVMQKTSASAKYKSRVAEIQTNALLDKDFTRKDEYIKQLKAAKDEALKGISNQGLANQLSMEFDGDAQIAAIKIDADAKEKEINENKFNLEVNATNILVSKATAGEQEREKLELDYEKMFIENRNTGTISKEEEFAIRQKANKSAAESIINSNPAYGRQLINEGVFNLSAEDKNKLKKQSYDIEKQMDISFKMNQIDEEVSVIYESFANGVKLSPGQVSNLVSSGKMTTEVGDAYIAFTLSPYYINQEQLEKDGDSFALMTKKIFESGNKKEIQSFIRSTLKGGADGKIRKDEIDSLIAVAMSKNKEIQSLDKNGMKNKHKKVDRVYKQVFDWMDRNATSEQKSDITSFALNALDKAPTDFSEQEMVDNLLTYAKTVVNPNARLHKVGVIYDFPGGKGECVGYNDSGTPIFRRVK